MALELVKIIRAGTDSRRRRVENAFKGVVVIAYGTYKLNGEFP